MSGITAPTRKHDGVQEGLEWWKVGERIVIRDVITEEVVEGTPLPDETEVETRRRIADTMGRVVTEPMIPKQGTVWAALANALADPDRAAAGQKPSVE